MLDRLVMTIAWHFAVWLLKKFLKIAPSGSGWWASYPGKELRRRILQAIGEQEKRERELARFDRYVAWCRVMEATPMDFDDWFDDQRWIHCRPANPYGDIPDRLVIREFAL